MNTIDIAVIRAAIRRDRSFMESLNRPTLRASRARLYLALAEAVVAHKAAGCGPGLVAPQAEIDALNHAVNAALAALADATGAGGVQG